MRDSGFSLLEIVIVIGVSVIVCLLIVSILVSNTGFSYKQTAIVSEGLSLNDVIREIDDVVRQASSVAVSYPETEPIFTTGDETLVLKLPSLSAAGNMDEVYDFLVIAKDENPKILKIKIFPDPQSSRASQDKVLTTILSSVKFSYLDENGNTAPPSSAVSIGVDLTVLSKTGSIGSNRSVSAVTKLRNN